MSQTKTPEFPKVIGGSGIAFCEDSSYKTQIWVHYYLEQKLKHRLKLFKVTLADESVVFCLADDAEGAIGQSSCRGGVETQTWEQQQALQVGATAILVENFKIRGWGHANFNAGE